MARNPYLNLFILTLVRIPVAVVLLGWLAWVPYTRLGFGVALGLMLIIEATDFLDGFLARRKGLVSEIGATLDPYADSTARMLTFAGLAAAGLALWVVPIAMAVRDVTVAYCRILIARSGGTASAKLSGKIKAVVQAAGAYLLLLGPLLWGNGFVQPGWMGKLATFAGVHAQPAGMPVVVISWIIAGVTLLSAGEYITAAVRAAAPTFPRR